MSGTPPISHISLPSTLPICVDLDQEPASLLDLIKFNQIWKPILQGVGLVLIGGVTIALGAFIDAGANIGILFDDFMDLNAGPTASYLCVGFGASMIKTGCTLLTSVFLQHHADHTGHPKIVGGPVLDALSHHEIQQKYTLIPIRADDNEIPLVPINNLTAAMPRARSMSAPPCTKYDVKK